MEKQLHIISTGKQTVDEFVEKVSYIHSDIHYIHLRERKWTAQEFIFAIEKLVKLGVPREKIVINDRIDVAAASNVGAVQLASHSLDVAFVKQHHPHLRIGCSVHKIEEAKAKEDAEADYVIYGHVFSTNSKAGVTPRGLHNLQKLVESINIPVIAIGGIRPENVKDVLKTGVAGIAVLSGILLANDIKQMVKRYKEALEEEGKEWS